MKILCVIDNLGSGGAQRQLVELGIGFKEKGNDVSFLTYHNMPFFNPVLEDHGIKITCIEEANYLKRLLKIRRYIKQGGFDSLLSFLEAPSFICECAGIPRRNWKLVVGERNANPKILKSPKQILYRWFHLFADYIVSNSSLNMEYVLSVNPLLKKSKCKVIHNIINFKYWQYDKSFKYRKNDKINLITASSHIYRKNANGLVEALALLNKGELEQIHIEWYGDRPNEPYYDNSLPEVRQKIRRYKLEKYISFYPATNELMEKVMEADAIGLFSFYEGLPNTVCEGMACGKPVVCSAISDLPSIISYNKNLLFNPSDPASIQQSLSYLISMDSRQMAQTGKLNLEIARENFDKEAIVADYLKLLEK